MRLDLSCVEHTVEGRFLGRILHSDVFDNVFKKEEVYRSSYNGGRHTFILSLVKPDDGEALLEIVKDTFGHVKGCAEFIALSRKKLSTALPTA